MDFGQWRSLVHAPSPESWEELKLALLQADLLSLDHAQLTLHYLEDQLKRWPRGLRLLSREEAAQLRPTDPRLRLSEGLDHTTYLEELAWLDKAITQGALQGARLEQLALTDSGAYQDGWGKEVLKPWMSEVPCVIAEQIFGASALGSWARFSPSLERFQLTSDAFSALLLGYGLDSPPRWPALEHLSTTFFPMTPGSLTLLAQAHMPSLRALRLHAMECGGIVALADAAWIAQLQHLTLELLTHAAESDEGDIYAWRAQRYGPLTEEGLVAKHGELAATELFHVLSRCSALETLCLGYEHEALGLTLLEGLLQRPAWVPSLKRLELICNHDHTARLNDAAERLRLARRSLQIVASDQALHLSAVGQDGALIDLIRPAHTLWRLERQATP